MATTDLLLNAELFFLGRQYLVFEFALDPEQLIGLVVIAEIFQRAGNACQRRQEIGQRMGLRRFLSSRSSILRQTDAPIGALRDGSIERHHLGYRIMKQRRGNGAVVA